MGGGSMQLVVTGTLNVYHCDKKNSRWNLEI